MLPRIVNVTITNNQSSSGTLFLSGSTAQLINVIVWGNLSPNSIQLWASSEIGIAYSNINNIVDSDYTLCYRGAANYSLRLYETLCLGRIPLFINTDCVLPFEDDIDWKGISIWVEDNELDILDKKIMEFHHSMTNSQFREKQKLCRETWVKFLSKEGFIMNFHKNLTQKHYLQNIGVFT